MHAGMLNAAFWSRKLQNVNGAGQNVNGAGQHVNGAGENINGAGQNVNGAAQNVNGAGKNVNGAGEKDRTTARIPLYTPLLIHLALTHL